jgi:crotonobetainyl-CoA:carnitine CoA-transferase CaiB-like acyl-CoA transferase
MTIDATATHQPAKALAGVRVLDLSQNLAGPYCAQTLADLGADVIKVEPPGGDPARQWGPPFHAGASTIFRAANRNKRSVALDLKTEEGRSALRRLIDGADVLVQSFRAGVIERLGFGERDVRAARPMLIYVSVTAYGDDGPLRDLPGYDPLMQAHGGLMSVTGTGGEPARVGTSIIDMGTGMWAAIAVLAALRERGRTGTGCHVVASLYETALQWNAYHLMGWFADGIVPRAHGTAFPLIAPYGAFECSDGRVMIAAANDRLFQRLCAVLALHDLAGDDALATNPARVAARARLDAAISEATARFTVDALLDALRAAGVPCAPILDIAHVAVEPQTLASGVLAHSSHAGDVPHVLMPVKWDGERLTVRREVPRMEDGGAGLEWLPAEG